MYVRNSLSFTYIGNKQPTRNLGVIQWPVLVPPNMRNFCFWNLLNFFLACQSSYWMALLLNLTTRTSLKSLMYINNSCLFLLSQISQSPCFNIPYSLNTIVLVYTFCPQAMAIWLSVIHICLSFLTRCVPRVYYPQKHRSLSRSAFLSDFFFEMLIPLWLSPFSFWPEPWLHHLPISQIQSAWSEPGFAFIAYLPDRGMILLIFIKLFSYISSHTLLFSFLYFFKSQFRISSAVLILFYRSLYISNYYSMFRGLHFFSLENDSEHISFIHLKSLIICNLGNTQKR